METDSGMRADSAHHRPDGRLAHVFRMAPACGLPEVLATLGTADAGVRAGLAPPVACRRVPAGATVLHEGGETRSLLVVRSGSFKCVRMLEDGYEQVLGFAWRGDVLGFEALGRGRSPTSVVALEVASVHVLPLADLPAWRRDCPALDCALQRALCRQLARAGEVAEMLAAISAQVRLARFLTALSARMAEDGQSPHRFWLRMGRRDIASLLGMAHSTVSRTFTSLAALGCLRVDNRSVEVLDPGLLAAYARSTRAPGPQPALAAGTFGEISMAAASTVTV